MREEYMGMRYCIGQNTNKTPRKITNYIVAFTFNRFSDMAKSTPCVVVLGLTTQTWIENYFLDKNKRFVSRWQAIA